MAQSTLFIQTGIFNTQRRTMKHLNLIIKLLSNLRSVFVLIILTRLLFVETNQMALFAEIIGSMAAVLINPSNADIVDD